MDKKTISPGGEWTISELLAQTDAIALRDESIPKIPETIPTELAEDAMNGYGKLVSDELLTEIARKEQEDIPLTHNEKVISTCLQGRMISIRGNSATGVAKKLGASGTEEDILDLDSGMKMVEEVAPDEVREIFTEDVPIGDIANESISDDTKEIVTENQPVKSFDLGGLVKKRGGSKTANSENKTSTTEPVTQLGLGKLIAEDIHTPESNERERKFRRNTRALEVDIDKAYLGDTFSASDILVLGKVLFDGQEISETRFKGMKYKAYKNGADKEIWLARDRLSHLSDIDHSISDSAVNDYLLHGKMSGLLENIEQDTVSILEESGHFKIPEEPVVDSSWWETIKEVGAKGDLLDLGNDLEKENMKTPSQENAGQEEATPLPVEDTPVLQAEAAALQTEATATPLEETGAVETKPNPELEGFTPENKGLFQSLTGGAKTFMEKAYEGVSKMASSSKIVGRLQIAYNSFFIDRNENKAVELKNKIDALNIKIESFNYTKTEIESAITELEGQNVPGVSALIAKLKVIEVQKIKLLGEKDVVQSEFEKRSHKTELYTNARDRVANRLIEHYDEKIEPLDKAMENLVSLRDQNELIVAVTEARLNEQKAKLAGVEKKKASIEERLKRTGMSDKEIRSLGLMKELEDMMQEGMQNIKKEKEALANSSAQIDKKIAKIDAQANPYKDKRDEFARITHLRPIGLTVPEREYVEEFDGNEKLQGNARYSEAEDGESLNEDPDLEDESLPENPEKLTAREYISGWNKYLIEKIGQSGKDQFVLEGDFLKATKLPGGFSLDFKDFKKILSKYYKMIKADMGSYDKHIDNFFTDKIRMTEASEA